MIMKKKQTIITEITFKKGIRQALPSGSGYAPHFVAKGDSTWLAVRFLDFPTNALFDTPYQVMVELCYPDKLDYSVLDDGNDFEVHEGAKIVATGRVLKGKQKDKQN